MSTSPLCGNPFAAFALSTGPATSTTPAGAATTATVRKRKRTVVGAGGGGLAATASLSGLTTHAEFVAALEAVTGDPLEPMGGRIVVYRGNPQAVLMVIGEAPGETEDQVGGKDLRNMPWV